MTYVPDYIFHPGSKSPVSGPTAPALTPNYSHRRINSFTSNRTRSAPSTRVRERSSLNALMSNDGNNASPSTHRRSATNPIYASSTRYFRAPQERVCGRVSIKDRLKSLESEAAVKLEVRHTTQRRHPRSLSHDATPQPLPRQDYDRQSKDNSSISSVNSVTSDSFEKVPGSLKVAMPKPDIISSNQPKFNVSMPQDTSKLNADPGTSGSEELSSDNHIQENNLHLADSNNFCEEKGAIRESDTAQEHENIVAKLDGKWNNMPGTEKKQEKRKPSLMGESAESVLSAGESAADDSHNDNLNPRYCSKGGIEIPSQSIRMPKPSAQSLLDSATDCCSTGIKEGIVRPARSAENLGPKPKMNHPKGVSAANGPIFKPVWRTPSLKQVHRPRDYSMEENNLMWMKERDKVSVSQLTSSSELGEKKIGKTPETTQTVYDDKQEQIDAIVTMAQSKSSPAEERDGTAGSVSLKATELVAVCETNAAATTGTTQQRTAYPVELRSPRHEHSGQAFRRQNTRDKRNAVFINPSSSDSDIDGGNQMSRMEKDFAKLSRAVDLLPDQRVVRENDSHGATERMPSPAVPIKHVSPVKFVPNLLRPNDKVATTPEAKKKSADLQSAKIYPELLTPVRSPRKGSKSYDEESKKDSQKSSNRRRKSTRLGRSGGAGRSKSTDARRAGRDSQRNRSNSMCDPQRMRQSREAVANAVIFGTGHGSTIPYIDDATSPVEDASLECKTAGPQRLTACDRGSIHRSNSADVLSTLVAETPHAKIRRGRASSVDRSTAKGVHRRSYQIATMPQDGDPAHRQNIDKLNKFLLQADDDDDGSRDSSLCDQDLSSRSGLLHYKVATIDKGKRTSSQKSWRLVWVTLKNQKLCLTKDSGKAKSVQNPLQERRLSQQPPEDVLSFSVQSSLVGIAYNYLKRKNVFKLTTFNGSEYLFQADSRNDMLAWISVIQKQSAAWEDGAEGISEDLILRKTNQIDSGPKVDKKSTRKRSPKPPQKNNLQVKDVDGSRRFKWRGSVNKIVKKFGTGQPFVMNGTFGVHLEDCPPSAANEFVPFIVELCCRIVEERGLQFTGIYRVPGNNAALSALQEDLNNHGAESIQHDDDRLRELNVVSSLLKSFFRKLPEPLFTNELYHDFIQANRKPTPESRLNSLRKLVHMLPGPHYETLKFLIAHLRLVADNCEVNKMEVRNLAIVFGPTLVRNTAADNTATMVTDMSDQCRIIESIIEHTEWFFSSNISEPAPESSYAAVPTEREHEAVPSIEFLLDNVGRKPGDSGNTSESAKSKGSDDAEPSLSRDLKDLFFGKKWKQHASQPAPSEQDDGGFGEYRSRKHDVAPAKKEREKSSSSDVLAKLPQPPPPPQPSQTYDIPERIQRLTMFCQEHLNRLSQTTVRETLFDLSSADSSPRATSRCSAPSIVPPSDVASRRGRASSDSQDARYHHVTSSNEIAPPRALHVPPPRATSHPTGAPQYKRQPNPFRPGAESTRPALEAPPRTRKPSSDYFDAQKARPAQQRTQNKVEGLVRLTSAAQKLSTSDLIPQIEPIISAREAGKENIASIIGSENIAVELPKTQSKTNPKASVTSSQAAVSDLKGPMKKSLAADASGESHAGHSKKLSVPSVDALADQMQRKRKKNPPKDGFSASPATTATSERLFSRGDPKRRGIRFLNADNERAPHLESSSKNLPLTATERLFDGQPLRRKHSTSRENRRQKVVRRHTLSGLRDLLQDSPVLKFKTNLQPATKGRNLSMHDLTSAQGQQRSAMERLDPKGATSGLTLSHWMVQERMRSKTSNSSGLTLADGARRKKDLNQFRSYV